MQAYPLITTNNLVLRPWELEDAEALFNILQEKDILRYFPSSTPPPREKVEKYILHHLTHWQQRGYGHWAVVSRADGQVIGWSGLEYLPEINETEIAFLLSQRVWGRGLATEAAQAAIHFGFASAGLETIVGLVHPENIASIRVLEKCGLAFVDQITLWGLALYRYRIHRHDSLQIA
jgi:ribosomal-protein-alanine N-acetyltransferase